MRKVVLLVAVISFAVALSASASVSLWMGGEPSGSYFGGNVKVGYPLFVELQTDFSLYDLLTSNYEISLGAVFLDKISLSTGIGIIDYNGEAYWKSVWKGNFSSDCFTFSLNGMITEGMNYGNSSVLVDIKTCPVGIRLNGSFNLTPPANEYSSLTGDLSLGDRLRVFFGLGRSYFLNHRTYYRSDNLLIFTGLRFIGKQSALEWAVQRVRTEDRYKDKVYFNFVFNASVFF